MMVEQILKLDARTARGTQPFSTNAETLVMNWKAFTVNLNSAQTLSLYWPTQKNKHKHKHIHTRAHFQRVALTRVVTLQLHMSIRLITQTFTSNRSNHFFLSNLSTTICSRFWSECCNLDSFELVKVKFNISVSSSSD